jgi:hypothetical protein
MLDKMSFFHGVQVSNIKLSLLCQPEKCEYASNNTAISTLFGKPNYPAIALKHLQSEGVLKGDRGSGWRDYPFYERLRDGGFAWANALKRGQY